MPPTTCPPNPPQHSHPLCTLIVTCAVLEEVCCSSKEGTETEMSLKRCILQNYGVPAELASHLAQPAWVLEVPGLLPSFLVLGCQLIPFLLTGRLKIKSLNSELTNLSEELWFVTHTQSFIIFWTVSFTNRILSYFSTLIKMDYSACTAPICGNILVSSQQGYH